MPAGDMSLSDVRTAALEAFQQAERYRDADIKEAWAKVGEGYARIYAADVERYK